MTGAGGLPGDSGVTVVAGRGREGGSEMQALSLSTL